MRYCPRLLAALWFAGAALLAVGPVFGVLTVRQGRFVPMVLFVVLPVLSGGLAGALLGERILRLEAGYLYGALNGLATTCLAVLLLGLLVGPVDGLLSILAGEGMLGPGAVAPSSYPGLLFVMIVMASLTMGPIIFPVGILAGLALVWFDRF